MLNQTQDVTIENEFEGKRGSVCCQAGLCSICRDPCRYFYTHNIHKELTTWKRIRIERLIVAYTLKFVTIYKSPNYTAGFTSTHMLDKVIPQPSKLILRLSSDFDGDANNRSFTSCIVSSDILRLPACCVRRIPLVSNFLTNFWMQHFDGARLSPNSVRNAIWHALNEPVCQYLRTRNTRCSTVYIFTHAAFDSQLPRCGNAEHRQMQVTGRVQYIAGGVHVVFHRCRYVYINFQVIISII